MKLKLTTARTSGASKMKWRELKQQIDDLDDVSDETEVVMMNSGNAADDVEAVHSLTSAEHRATVILSGIAEDDDPENDSVKMLSTT
jgi:hypothetical protein